MASKNRGFIFGKLGEQASLAPPEDSTGAWEQAGTNEATGFQLRRCRQVETLGPMAIVECKFEVAPETAEVLEEQVALLADARWIVWEDRIASRMWVAGYFNSRREAKEACHRLATVVGPEGMTGETEYRELAAGDWAESYKAHFKAWRIGHRHWVPEWERGTCRVAPGDEIVWLDPGMAFGTGNHESTRLCCERLVEYVDACRSKTLRPRRRHSRRTTRVAHYYPGVIDAGCGSGILGISAARFGLGPVVGFDNDPIAVRVSRENALLNQVANRTGFFEGDLSTGLADRQAGLVLANIQTDVLRQGARALVGAVTPGGWLALSGILANELNDFRADFLAVAESAAVIQPGKRKSVKRSGSRQATSARCEKIRAVTGWKTVSRRLGEWADLLLIRSGCSEDALP
jgi:ribosomal protein L11 methyltransferase